MIKSIQGFNFHSLTSGNAISSDSSLCLFPELFQAEAKDSLLPRNLHHLKKREEKRGQKFCGMSESKMRGEARGGGMGRGPPP